tara:strand:+ start:254 stop:1159 length:906 start_codon:yes stop_codon:yes gene_type:complete
MNTIKLEYRIRSFFLKIDKKDYFFSKILKFIYKIVVFKKNFPKLSSKDIEKYKDKNLELNGFERYTQINTFTEKVILRSNEIIKSPEFLKNLDSEKKVFLQTYQVRFLECDNHIFLKFLFENKLLNRIISYIGHDIILSRIQIMFSENKVFEPGRSQNFHMDGDDSKQIKVFFHLSDIDLESGPLNIISKSNSRMLYNEIKQNRLIKKKTKRLSDEEVAKYLDKDQISTMTGNKGTTYLIDTSNCYHFGSRPGKKVRYILMYQFLPSSSYYLPMAINTIKSFGKSDILSNEEISVIDKITY